MSNEIAAAGDRAAVALGAQVDEIHQVIDGRGTALVSALGEKSQDISGHLASVGVRAMQALEHAMK